MYNLIFGLPNAYLHAFRQQGQMCKGSSSDNGCVAYHETVSREVIFRFAGPFAPPYYSALHQSGAPEDYTLGPHQLVVPLC